MSQNDRLTCEEVVEQLFTFLDKELDDASSAEIQRHLDRCRECFTRAEFESRLRAKVREAAAATAPEHLHRRIRRMLDQL